MLFSLLVHKMGGGGEEGALIPLLITRPQNGGGGEEGALIRGGGGR